MMWLNLNIYYSLILGRGKKSAINNFKHAHFYVRRRFRRAEAAKAAINRSNTNGLANDGMLLT